VIQRLPRRTAALTFQFQIAANLVDRLEIAFAAGGKQIEPATNEGEARSWARWMN
jgi:hypothetical protein